MPRQSQGTTGTGTQQAHQQGQPWRQNAATMLRTGIQALETELAFQRRILTEFTGGTGTVSGRRGTAGGVRARRATRATGGGAGGGTGGTNVDWVTNLLRQHGNGMTAPEIKAAAQAAGRTVGQSYPYDSLRTLARNKQIRQRGNRYYWAAGTGGTGTVTRSGTARTRARARKPMGRAMTAAGG